MKKNYLIYLMAAALLMAACSHSVAVSEVNMIPEPAFMVQKDGSYTLRRNLKVSINGMGQNSPVAKHIMKSFRAAHLHPSLVSSSDKSDITFSIYDTINTEIGNEGYLLEVRSSGVRIAANTEIGLLYGYQSLIQILPSDINRATYRNITLPECTILDYPRFAWRGLNLNLSGTPMPTKSLKRVVDVMLSYKMNRLCLDGGIWNADSTAWLIDSVEVYSAAELRRLADYAASNGVSITYGQAAHVAYSMPDAIDSTLLADDVIVEPKDFWHLEHYQADKRYHPHAFDGIISLSKAYSFNTLLAERDALFWRNIAGGQCRLLTDCTDGIQQLEFMLLPRMLAVAECLWSQPEKMDWGLFRRKIEVQKDRLAAHSHSYCEGSFTPQFTARRVDSNTMNISISTEVPNTYIFYTTDLTTPTRKSLIYIGPINLARGTHIKILPVYNDIVRDSVYEFVIK